MSEQEQADPGLPPRENPTVVVESAPKKGFIKRKSTLVIGGVVVAMIVVVLARGGDDKSKASLGLAAPPSHETAPELVDPRVAADVKQRDQENFERLVGSNKAMASGASYMPKLTNESEDPLAGYGQESKPAQDGSVDGIAAVAPLPPSLTTAAPPSATPDYSPPPPKQGPSAEDIAAANAAATASDGRVKSLLKAMGDGDKVTDGRIALNAEVNWAQREGKDETQIGGGALSPPAAPPSLDTPPARVLARTGTLYFGVMDLEANSDYSRFVQATIIGGPLDGAKVQGQFNRTDDRLEIVFTRAALRNKTIEFKAIAVNPETPQVGMATEVNRHYLERFGGFFVASFAKGYGQELSRQGTSISVNADTGTVSQSVPRRSNGDLALIGAGETAREMSSFLRRGLDRPPTVIVAASTEIGILMTGDAVDRPISNRSGDDAQPQPARTAPSAGDAAAIAAANKAAIEEALRDNGIAPTTYPLQMPDRGRALPGLTSSNIPYQ